MEKVFGEVGGEVPKSGNYICGNCGHYVYYDEGDYFDSCPLCGEDDMEWELED